MTYAVYSLFPALYLGYHAIRMSVASSTEAQLKRANCKVAKLIGFMYMILGAAMLAARICWHFQPKHTHQLSHQHEWSFEASRSFLIRFWGVMQFGASIILSVVYHRAAKSIKKAAKEQAEKTHEIERDPQVPFYHDPGYKSHVLV